MTEREGVSRCPRCGGTSLTPLRKRDPIDRMWWRNLLARLRGGTLYHCSFCRLQFYDVRGLAERVQTKRL